MNRPKQQLSQQSTYFTVQILYALLSIYTIPKFPTSNIMQKFHIYTKLLSLCLLRDMTPNITHGYIQLLV